ncbi:MAG: hypothetical protein ACI89T_001478 [Cognaticolwellia sp.]|jgi:hypothetical protein
MTFAKKSSLAIAILLNVMLGTIVLVYLARVALLKDFTEEQLALYRVKINCLDFKLSTDLKLEVSRLCLQTSLADIILEDMTIKFDLTAEQKIKRIDIASATIKGTADLFTAFKNSPQESNDTTLTQQLNNYLTQLSEANLPFNINVVELHYSPFSLKSSLKVDTNNATKTASYLGRFSVVQNTVVLSLKDFQDTRLLTVSFSTKNSKEQQLTADFSSQLKPLKHFLLTHKLPLSPAILETLEIVAASGEFKSVVNYQAGQLTIASQLKGLSIAAEGIEGSGPFALTGALNMHSQVNLAVNNHTADNQDSNHNAELEFQKNNTLQLQFSHQHLLDYLTKQLVSAEIIKLLTDNPVDQLTFSPKGKVTYNLSNQHMTLSGLTLEAKNDLLVHQLNLDNIELDLNHYLNRELTHNLNNSPTLVQSNITERDNLKNKNVNRALPKESMVKENTQNESPLIAQLDFKLDSPLLLSAINNYTHSPLVLKLQGSISQKHAKTSISFDEDSSLVSNNIAIPTKQNKGDKKLFSIKKLTTQVQGNVEIQSHMQVKDNVQVKEKQSINLNLSLNTQAKKLRAANIIEMKMLAINTGVTGNLNDIKIFAAATADNVPLGSLAVSGAIDKPSFVFTAKNLQLTELLSLNIKLPKKVDLVEGALSYNVKGQVTDLKNIQNTPLALSFDITSLSGEIEGIWIQALNWQQNFQFLNGEFSTLDYATESSSENLTVALIDTPTPISKLSINTSWRYQKDFKFSATKLKGDILGGSFAIPKVQWPLDQEHSVDVQLTRIDLEQVLALDKKQGIVVTGNISGKLPIRYDGEKYTMEKGELHNVTNGLIQVINNPAVEKLKASNTQLQLAFDALQNLHYHQLSSDVSMADDGYMLLQTVIKGRNPDIDNDVNLNLNLSYDLLGLLESMSITEQFEDRIINSLQNIKE